MPTLSMQSKYVIISWYLKFISAYHQITLHVGQVTFIVEIIYLVQNFSKDNFHRCYQNKNIYFK